MRIALPMKITDTNLVSNNIKEDDHAIYSATKAYVENEYVIRNHFIYQALLGVDVSSIPEWDTNTQYLPGQRVKVSADSKVYTAVSGVVPADYSEYSSGVYYITGQYCKISSLKKTYKALAGEALSAHTEWSASTTYTSGDYCQLAGTKVVYKSLKNTNLNHDPSTSLTGIDPYWAAVGFLNIGTPPDTSILYTEWVATTAYAVDAVVKVTSSGSAFKCLIANTGNSPVDSTLGSSPKWKQIDSFTSNQTSPTQLWGYAGTINQGFAPKDNMVGDNPSWAVYGPLNYNLDPEIYQYGTDAMWAKISPTNAWRMFDGTVSSQTIGTSINPLTNETLIAFSVQTVTSMNCIAFFDTFVTRITLTLKRPDGTILWSEVANITKNISVSVTDYFFSDKYEAPVNLFRIFPAVPGAILDVEMYSPSTCKCGLCVIGKSRYIGKTQNGAKLSIVDYSKKSTSDYGVTSLSVGPYAKELACDLYLKNADIDIIYDWIATIRATPIVVIGDNSNESSVQYQSLMMYGYYSDFSVTIPGPVMSVCSFEVKGLI